MMIPTACMIALLTTATLAQAGDPTIPGFTCTQPQLIGLVTGLNDPLALTIDGDYAYMIYRADFDDHLAIIDVSDHSNPQLLSTTEFSDGNSAALIINGDALYYHNYSDFIAIWNIEDKTDPWFVRSYEADFFSNIAVTGDYIYQRFDNSALNVSRPHAPGLDRIADPDFEFDDAPIAILNNELITTTLDRYNIDDPLNPILISQHPQSTPQLGLYRYEDPYFINLFQSGGDELGVISQNPTTNALSRTDYTLQESYDYAIRGDLIFSTIASAEPGISIDTLTNPPMKIATHTEGIGIDRAQFIRRHRDHFVVVSDEAFTIYDIPTNPVAAARTNSHTSFLELMDNTAVLSSGNISTTRVAANVVDISNPAEPRWVADLPVAEPFGLASRAQTVFVAGKQEGLLAFDLSNAAQPELRATYNTSINQAGISNTRDVCIMGSYAYVADRNSGLTIYTIGPDQLLTPLSSLPLPQATQRVRVQGNLAFVSTIRALFLVDISNPQVPEVLSSIDAIPGTDNFMQTAVMHDQLLYTADSTAGYRIFDVSDISSPVELALFNLAEVPPNGSATPEVFDLSIRNNLLYVATSRRGIAVYDNSDPFNPVLLRHIEPNADGAETNISRYRDIDFRNNLLYTSAGDAGLRIYDLNDCAGPCPIDFNTDGNVDFFDVAVFLAAFGMHEPLADLEPDGEFNYFDVAAFLAIYQAGCP